MADFSTYTHKWRATTNNSHADANKISKRNRQPTSCQACRIRKLKCDKGHPCEACTKRGEEDACNYGKVITAQPVRKEDVKASGKAQDRLRQLEDLVRQLAKPAEEDRQQHPTSAQNNENVEGPLNRGRHGISYTGSTHWSAVLDQIQDLRLSLTSDPTTDECIASEYETKSRSSAIFGAVQPPALLTILQYHLPPRKQVDRFLSTYFNAKFMIVPFVHTGQFQRQYENFWRDQGSTSPIWVSILFSIICISDMIRKATADDESSPNSSTMTDHHLTAAAQCLVLGDYTKPQPHLIEALCMHVQCKYVLSLDPNREIGLIFSIIVRQAYTMGYHRDPSKFPGQFSPFEGEQRRRCWSAVKQFDLMISFQLGIPQNVLPESGDTKLPRNIADSDFDEDTTILPPARPDTEPSPMLYFVVKCRLMDVYSKVVRNTLSFPTQPTTNTEVMALHNEITQASDSIPQVLRARPMSLSYSDPSYLIMLRTHLVFVTQKTFCVLHRKYMAGSDPGASYSRKACVEAGTRLVSHFVDLHGELAPGGQLYQDRWMVTSFTINDFLFAAMLLCITIWQSQKNFISKDSQNLLEQDAEARSRFDLLVKAQGICAEYGRRSVETRHVAEVLSHVLDKIRSASPGTSNKEISEIRGDTQNHSIDTTGATFAQSSLTIQAVNNNTHIPPDLTPLSMNNQFDGTNLSPSYTAILTDPTTTMQSTISSSTEDPSSTWIFNPVPAVTKPQDPFAIPRTSLTNTTNLTQNSLPSPFSGMLESDPRNIDWLSFDTFLTSAFDTNQMQDIDYSGFEASGSNETMTSTDNGIVDDGLVSGHEVENGVGNVNAVGDGYEDRNGGTTTNPPIWIGQGKINVNEGLTAFWGGM